MNRVSTPRQEVSPDAVEQSSTSPLLQMVTPRGTPAGFMQALPLITPRGTPAGFAPAPGRRRRRNAVPCIKSDERGSFEGLTELDGLFGGADGGYKSIIRLTDKVETSEQKTLRCVKMFCHIYCIVANSHTHRNARERQRKRDRFAAV